VVGGGGCCLCNWVDMIVSACFGYIHGGAVGGVCHSICCWWLVGGWMIPVGDDNDLQSWVVGMVGVLDVGLLDTCVVCSSWGLPTCSQPGKLPAPHPT
jgi:hypothetical protein